MRADTGVVTSLWACPWHSRARVVHGPSTTAAHGTSGSIPAAAKSQERQSYSYGELHGRWQHLKLTLRVLGTASSSSGVEREQTPAARTKVPRRGSTALDQIGVPRSKLQDGNERGGSQVRAHKRTGANLIRRRRICRSSPAAARNRGAPRDVWRRRREERREKTGT